MTPPPRPASPNRLPVIASVVFAIAAAGGIGVGLLGVALGRPTATPAGDRAIVWPAATPDPLERPTAIVPVLPAPALALTDQDGRPFDLASVRGTPALVFFGYTHCPDVCPTTLADVRDAVKQSPVPVRVVFVTIDPARDDAAAMKQYLVVLQRGLHRADRERRRDPAHGGRLGRAVRADGQRLRQWLRDGPHGRRVPCRRRGPAARPDLVRCGAGGLPGPDRVARDGEPCPATRRARAPRRARRRPRRPRRRRPRRRDAHARRRAEQLSRARLDHRAPDAQHDGHPRRREPARDDGRGSDQPRARVSRGVGPLHVPGGRSDGPADRRRRVLHLGLRRQQGRLRGRCLVPGARRLHRHDRAPEGDRPGRRRRFPVQRCRPRFHARDRRSGAVDPHADRLPIPTPARTSMASRPTSSPIRASTSSPWTSCSPPTGRSC